MACATAVQLSGRAGWLLQLLIAVCLLTQWCESQCSPPSGAETVVEVDWSLASAQDGRLAAGVCVAKLLLNCTQVAI